MRVRQLVSDVNQTVAKLRAEQAKLRGAAPGSAAAAELANLNDLAGRLVTPPIRYSQPGLQTHITYLYGMTNGADQKIGRDAIERYGSLRKSLDEITAELNRVTAAGK